MGATTKMAFPYPENSAAVDVVYDISQLATSLDTAFSANMATYTPTLNFTVGTAQGWWKRVANSNIIVNTFLLTIAAGQAPAYTTTPLTINLGATASSYTEITGTGHLSRSTGYVPYTLVGISSTAVGIIFGNGGVAAGTRMTGQSFPSWNPGDTFVGTVVYRGVSA